MAIQHPKFLAAAVQAAPAFMDLRASVDKTVSLIAEAGRNGARLIAFPETWIPGYPLWAWLDAPAWAMQFVQQYHDNSLDLGSAEAAEIATAAAEHNIYVMLGFSERAAATLYISQALIGADGEFVFCRRKLKPTHVERTVFGEGDGSDFKVVDTELGRLGGLCCWEHLQPLSKYAMYAMNEQVHVSAWPTFALYDGIAYALGHEVNLRASQIYALEGQCFVLAPTAVTTPAIVEQLADSAGKKDLLKTGGGYTKIFAPDGQQISEDLPPDQEGLVYAEIDLGMISLAKAAADPAGHYARPDVTRLLLDDRPRRPVERASERADAPAEEPADTETSEFSA